MLHHFHIPIPPNCSSQVLLYKSTQVADFFARWIQRTSPKSTAQAHAEVRVTRIFFENFSGDQV